MRLELGAVPLLPGAAECVRMGVFSSLQPANVRLKRAIANERECVAAARDSYPLLFDPQTAGGLLAAVPAAAAAGVVAELRAAGYAHTCVIGEVLDSAPANPGTEPHYVHCVL